MSHLGDLRHLVATPDELVETAQERLIRRTDDLYEEYVWELAQLLGWSEDQVRERF